MSRLGLVKGLKELYESGEDRNLQVNSYARSRGWARTRIRKGHVKEVAGHYEELIKYYGGMNGN